MKYLFIALLWVAYCALHSYLISIRFTNLMTKVLGKYNAFYRIFYVVISFILLVPLINFTTQSENEVLITYGSVLSTIRYILIIGSLLMFGWAFFINYDSLSFFGIRQMMSFWKSDSNKSSGELKKNGLLSVTRHPMYFALIIFLWCQTFRIMDVVVNSILTIYVIIGTILEERKLVLEFGDTYRKYQDEVPMLIPFTK